jgi:hypothetical protein
MGTSVVDSPECRHHQSYFPGTSTEVRVGSGCGVLDCYGRRRQAEVEL